MDLMKVQKENKQSEASLQAQRTVDSLNAIENKYKMDMAAEPIREDDFEDNLKIGDLMDQNQRADMLIKWEKEGQQLKDSQKTKEVQKLFKDIQQEAAEGEAQKIEAEEESRKRLREKLNATFKGTGLVMVKKPQYASLFNTYAERYENSVGEKKRGKKIKNKKSRLYAKDTNAITLEAAEQLQRHKRNVAAGLRLSLSEEERGEMEPQQLRDYSELAQLLSTEKNKSSSTLFRELIKMHSPIAEGEDEAKKENEKEDFLSDMTKRLLKINFDTLDLTDDKVVAGNVQAMENNLKFAEIYERLLKQSPDFLNKLDDKDKRMDAGDDSPGGYESKILLHLERIKAVGAYYRVRKLIIQNPYYRTHYNHELSMNASEEDTPEQKYLSKLLRASFYLGKNLRAMGLAGENDDSELAQRRLISTRLGRSEDEYNARLEEKYCLISSDSDDYENNQELMEAKNKAVEAEETLALHKKGSSHEQREFVLNNLDKYFFIRLTQEQYDSFYARRFQESQNRASGRPLSGEEQRLYRAFKVMMFAHREAQNNDIEQSRMKRELMDYIQTYGQSNPIAVSADRLKDVLSRELSDQRQKKIDNAENAKEWYQRLKKSYSDNDAYQMRRDALVDELEREARYMPRLVEKVDVDTLPERKLTKDMVLGGMMSASPSTATYMFKKSGIINSSLKERISAYINKNNISTSIGIVSDRFSGEKGGTFVGGDKLTRLIENFAGPIFSELTENEVFELVQDLSHTYTSYIQAKRTENKLTNKEQSVEERRFVDAYARYLDINYSFCRSVMNSLGDTLEFLHPKDMLRLLTPKQAAILTSFITSMTNITMVKPNPLELLRKNGKDISHLKDFHAVLQYFSGIGSTTSVVSGIFIDAAEGNQLSGEVHTEDWLESHPDEYDHKRETKRRLQAKIDEVEEKINSAKNEAEKEKLQNQKAEYLDMNGLLPGQINFILDSFTNVEKRKDILEIVDDGNYSSEEDLLDKRERQEDIDHNAPYVALNKQTVDEFAQEIKYSVIGIENGLSKEERAKKIKQYENSPEKEKLDKEMEAHLREFIPKTSEEKKRKYLESVRKRHLGRYIFTKEEKEELERKRREGEQRLGEQEQE